MVEKTKGLIEFRGWIDIYDTTDGEDNPERMQEITAKIEEKIHLLEGFGNACELRNMGWNFSLWLGGNRNHDNGYSESIFELLHNIAEIAKGSYGLVYLRWPEAEEKYNDFVIYKLARGKLTIEKDSLLSPCDPVIEGQ